MKRILIVDDEDDIREVAQMCFEIAGDWEIYAAGSGREAIEIAESGPLDVILMDVMMPDLDGPATFKILQGKPETRDIPVVLLTAKVQAADRAGFADIGVLGVIAKPFDPMSLAQDVEEKLREL